MLYNCIILTVVVFGFSYLRVEFTQPFFMARPRTWQIMKYQLFPMRWSCSVFWRQIVKYTLGNSFTVKVKEEEDLEPGEIAVGDEPEAADDPDERSVFVKNVDFSVNEEMLAEHFKECG